jgi:hypothetical protein
MKKTEIIELIQNKEALAYLDLQQCTQTFGGDHHYTKRSRAVWGVLDDLLKDLNILPNLNLEANKEAIQIIIKAYSTPTPTTQIRIYYDEATR